MGNPLVKVSGYRREKIIKALGYLLMFRHLNSIYNKAFYQFTTGILCKDVFYEIPSFLYIVTTALERVAEIQLFTFANYASQTIFESFIFFG